MSATPDSTLANPEQLIADLERQLAECRAERDEAQQQLVERTIERDEAHAQQTATAEVLQVINSSPGGIAATIPLPDYTNRDISEEPVYGPAESAVLAEASPSG